MADKTPMWIAVRMGVLSGGSHRSGKRLRLDQVQVNSFTATIGTGAIISRHALEYSDSKPIFVSKTTVRHTLGLGRVACVSLAGILLVAAIVSAVAVSANTVGRWVYMVRGSPHTAQLVGIPVVAV